MLRVSLADGRRSRYEVDIAPPARMDWGMPSNSSSVSKRFRVAPDRGNFAHRRTKLEPGSGRSNHNVVHNNRRASGGHPIALGVSLPRSISTAAMSEGLPHASTRSWRTDRSRRSRWSRPMGSRWRVTRSTGSYFLKKTSRCSRPRVGQRSRMASDGVRPIRS